MRRLTVDALEASAAKCNKLRDAFKPFVEVLAIDSSLVRLHAGLKKQYPSVWTNHTEASAKLTIVTNVVGRGPKTLTINPGSRSDVHLLGPGKWLRGRLIIFDLGFYQARLFKSIDDHGGYFLSRLRKQGNPTVIKSYRHGQKFLEGKKLREHQDAVSQDIIDIEGEVTYALKRDKVTHHTARFRIIAVYNYNLRCWHRYITNAPPQLLPAENVTALFAARWEIELLFRELKTVYRLADMPSGNLCATQALLYAAVLTLLTSRKLLQLVRKRATLPLHRFPIDRWARLFASVACDLLSLLAARRCDEQRSYKLLEFLCREAPDPNRSRLLLAERAQNGTMMFA
jgi:IS4 transposase